MQDTSGDTPDAVEADEGDDEEDPEWERASLIVDEMGIQLSQIMAQARSAPKKEKQALMVRKRSLEGSSDYVAALQYLEDPAGERKRRRLEALAEELERLIGEGVKL